jgi:ABC-type transporter Mla subunit MlaD
METTRVERPEQLALEIGRWTVSVTTVAVTVVFVLVVGMLLNSNRTNNNRAEDWRRRAVAAEEVAGGLRVVLADRSKTLNQRTRQANVMAATLASSRGALRQTKSRAGALAQQQRQLAGDFAQAETARRKLAAQRAALASVASALSACSQGLQSVVAAAQQRKPKAELAKAEPFLTQCNRARTRLGTALKAE